ncbi:hypothetical protein Q9189_007218 [Teloschistes chrysophthalmus]
MSQVLQLRAAEKARACHLANYLHLNPISANFEIKLPANFDPRSDTAQSVRNEIFEWRTCVGTMAYNIESLCKRSLSKIEECKRIDPGPAAEFEATIKKVLSKK